MTLGDAKLGRGARCRRFEDARPEVSPPGVSLAIAQDAEQRGFRDLGLGKPLPMGLQGALHQFAKAFTRLKRIVVLGNVGVRKLSKESAFTESFVVRKASNRIDSSRIERGANI